MSTTRRSFLGLLGLGAVGAVVPLGGHLTTKPEAMPTKGELWRMAKENQSLVTLTVAPDGLWTLTQISEELALDVPEVAGRIWADGYRHLAVQHRNPGLTPRELHDKMAALSAK